MKKVLILISVLLITLTACSNSPAEEESKLMGEWISTETLEQTGETITKTLILNPNGQFNLTIDILKKDENNQDVTDTEVGEGEYTYTEDTITLSYKTITGSVAVPVEINSDDLLGITSDKDTSFNYKVDSEELQLINPTTQQQIVFEKGTVE